MPNPHLPQCHVGQNYLSDSSVLHLKNRSGCRVHVYMSNSKPLCPVPWVRDSFHMHYIFKNSLGWCVLFSSTCPYACVQLTSDPTSASTLSLVLGSLWICFRCTTSSRTGQCVQSTSVPTPMFSHWCWTVCVPVCHGPCCAALLTRMAQPSGAWLSSCPSGNHSYPSLTLKI